MNPVLWWYAVIFTILAACGSIFTILASNKPDESAALGAARRAILMALFVPAWVGVALALWATR